MQIILRKKSSKICNIDLVTAILPNRGNFGIPELPQINATKKPIFFHFSPFLCINHFFHVVFGECMFMKTLSIIRSHENDQKVSICTKRTAVSIKIFQSFLTDSTSKFQHKMHALPQIFTKLGENSLWGPIYYFILLF